MLNIQQHLINSYIYRLNLDFKLTNPFVISERAVELANEYRYSSYSFYEGYLESKSSSLFNLNIKNLSREIYFYNEFLNQSNTRLDITFNEINSEIKNLAKTLIESEELLYKNKRMVLNNIKYSERISLFEDSDFDDLNNFKDPKEGNYKYFNNRNMCNNKHSLLKLPLKESVEVVTELIQIDELKSTSGEIKRDLSNLDNVNSSFQYFAKTTENTGSELCLKLRFSTAERFNEIVFKDASLHSIFIKKIEDENLNEVKFKSIQRGIKDIVLFEELVEAKIVYIYFEQNKYIDYGNEQNSIYEEMISNSYLTEKLSSYTNPTKKYSYEFCIDELKVYRNSFKKEGIFRYNKVMKANNLKDIKVKTNYFLKNESIAEEYYLEVKRYENEFSYREGIVSSVLYKNIANLREGMISLNNNEDAIEEIKLILILRNNSNSLYNSSYIKSIDIDIIEESVAVQQINNSNVFTLI